jgi:hypothetical protein
MYLWISVRDLNESYPGVMSEQFSVEKERAKRWCRTISYFVYRDRLNSLLVLLDLAFTLFTCAVSIFGIRVLRIAFKYI